MKKLFTILIALLLLNYTYGQQSTKDDDIKVSIVKTIVENGDTTIEERTLEGEQAKRFMERDHRMKEHHKMMRAEGLKNRVDGDRVDAEKSVVIVRDNPSNTHIEKTIIYRSGDKKGTEEVIVNGGEGDEVRRKVIIRTLSDDHTDKEIDIELEDGKLIIIRNGEKEVIELNEISNKVIETEGGRKGKTFKKVVVIDEVEEENSTDGEAIFTESPLKLEIMPNPNSGVFTITYELMKGGNADLIITDGKGKKISEEKLKGQGLQKKQIDIQRFGSGVYIINLNQNNEALSKKVIVE